MNIECPYGRLIAAPSCDTTIRTHEELVGFVGVDLVVQKSEGHDRGSAKTTVCRSDIV